MQNINKSWLNIKFNIIFNYNLIKIENFIKSN